MKASRVVAGVIGALFALVAVALLLAGGALLWVHSTQRDADGFLTSPTYELTTLGHALVSEEIDLASRPGDWWPQGIADVRFEIQAADAGAVFVGIGPADDVAGYLGDVARDEITRMGVSTSDVRYRTIQGTSPDVVPTDQDFWVASVSGPGVQTLTWEAERGEWAVVVMNADGSAPVAVDAEGAVRIAALLAIAIGLLIGGVIVAGVTALLFGLAFRRALAPEEEPAVAVPSEPYPVLVEGALDPGLSPWMWLVKWLLAIPHYIVLAFLWVAFAVLTVVAFFAILFTGRYPRGIFDFNVGVIRWSWRVAFYAFAVAGTDRYPPFALQVTDYPAHFDVAYPEELSRGRVLVKWWLLAIPHYFIVGAFSGALSGILVLVAVLALAFTRRYPQGLFDFVMGLSRWELRVLAYASLMRDDYPPFRLDQGGEDPLRLEPSPGEPAGGDAVARKPAMSTS